MFDPLKVKLNKSNLIEASAGTGKTHIISVLYLRFLLNINIDKKFCNLNLEKILIVTFTELAVSEIKKRIKKFIKDLRFSLIFKKNINKKIQDIFQYVKNKKDIFYLLNQCERKVDILSIYTIHGFCKKIIFTNFFESNIDFYSNIISTENNLIYELVLYYWKRKISFLSTKLFKIILSYWKNPQKLFNFILPLFSFIDLKFNYHNNNINSIKKHYIYIINLIKLIKKQWIMYFKKIIKLFKILNIKKYNNKINKWFNEINIWVKDETKNFFYPVNLKKFCYKYLFIYFKNCVYFLDIKNLFKNIEFFLKIKNNLYYFIIINCFKFVKKKIKFEKKKRSYLSFNDLVFFLKKSLTGNYKSKLINFIRKNFPVVLIDEFQDTDYIQYSIFNKIYIKNFSKYLTKIILIGDPKQTIYSFRGANIFNYFAIKKNIDCFYSFNINWRSSSYMVSAINTLFSKNDNIFIFKDLKYLNLISSKNNKKLCFLKKKEQQCAVKFFFFSDFSLKDNYKEFLAYHCAYKILKILDKKNNFYIFLKNGKKRSIIPSDIAVLVYSNVELEIIYNVFNKLNLPILCNSYIKKNIFTSLTAKEVFFVLKSILTPESKDNMSSTLSTNIFDMNLYDIHNFINDKDKFYCFIDELYSYYKIWDNFNIFSMFRNIISKKNLISRLSKKKYGNQYLVNLIHICEILQKKYNILKNKFFLLNWLNKKILSSSNIDKKEYNIRLYDNNLNGINISTIHKSKGLQYNIVFMPFLINLHINNEYYIYHDRENFKLRIDLYKKKKNKKFYYEELKSEEIRLFYVALTRSIYQCNIFLYNVKKDILKSILNFIYEKNNLKNFKKDHFIFKNIFNFKYIKTKIFNNVFNDKNEKNISFKEINIIPYKRIEINKKLFSYSNIIKYLKNNVESKYIMHHKHNNDIKRNILPRGKNTGNFFHSLLEDIKFSNVIDSDLIKSKLNEFNIDNIYFKLVKKIIFNIFNVVLYPLKISFLNKKVIFLFKEFNFILPIKKSISLSLLNNLFNKYHNLFCKKLNNISDFNLYGFLNGIIDLIFIYKNKYYIVDYKSNYFGKNYKYYSEKKINKVIYNYKYYIQYIFYILALNNYLKLKINNYKYEIHFGGVYYIFFRGLKLNLINNISNTGIFYVKPNIKLINKLRVFFNKKNFYD